MVMYPSVNLMCPITALDFISEECLHLSYFKIQGSFLQAELSLTQKGQHRKRI